MKQKAVLGRLALLTTAIIWGSAFLVMKNTVDSVPPVLLLAIRFTMGFTVLGVIFFKKWRKLSRSTLLHGLLIGLMLGTAYIIQTYGLRLTTAGKNAFLTTIYCVLVPFVEWLFFRAKPRRSNWIAAVLCMAGIGFVSLESLSGINTGDLLTLLCGVAFSLHVTFVGRWGANDDPILLTIIQFFSAAALCWLCTLFLVREPVHISPADWRSLLYLGLASTSLAILLQNVGQSLTPPSSAAILLSLESVFGVLFSVLLGSETLNLRLITGFALIFISVIISETGSALTDRNT